MYSPFQNSKNLQLKINVTWHDAYRQQHDEISKIKYIFNHQMPYPNIEEMDDSINFKSKPLRSNNNWTNDIDNEVNDPFPIIRVTNTIDIEHYDLRSNFVIQSCNGSNQKSQTLEDENFTKSSYYMIIENFEYCSLLRQLNEEQIFIFDDVMHRK